MASARMPAARTPVAAAAAMAARKIQDKARKIAAYLLECATTTSDGSRAKFSVKGSPDRAKTIQEIAFAAYTNHPQGMEAGLEAVSYYDPPNLTYPFGSYICVVDIDKGTGEVKIRRFVAVDDCGNIINPMIVEGQIHGGLTMGLAPALFEEIVYDENGKIQGGSFIDYLLPTAVETPKWEMGKTATPSPHHPLGAKGVGESATVGAPPRSPTPSSTRSGISVCATSTSRSRRPRSGSSSATVGASDEGSDEKAELLRWRPRPLAQRRESTPRGGLWARPRSWTLLLARAGFLRRAARGPWAWTCWTWP